MDLKELKKITAYARKSGIKSLKFDGFEIELHESALVSKPTQRLKPVAPPALTPETLVNMQLEPTLQQINDYIYNDVDGTM